MAILLCHSLHTGDTAAKKTEYTAGVSSGFFDVRVSSEISVSK
jgi:hypothetical protein